MNAIQFFDWGYSNSKIVFHLGSLFHIGIFGDYEKSPYTMADEVYIPFISEKTNKREFVQGAQIGRTFKNILLRTEIEKLNNTDLSGKDISKVLLKPNYKVSSRGNYVDVMKKEYLYYNSKHSVMLYLKTPIYTGHPIDNIPANNMTIEIEY
ncbi:hypothetical protein [Capnocytophaga leadbetteri]|uniref:hypothetical protein n=1 Tax=Capnocytophaga leadbetteri TaxID=327575 RepID=UPI0028E76AE5|nr:hypothetical protein [Capnocytophaga leadbetteri]